MRKFKYLIVFCLSLFLTGCSVEYNLEIDGNLFKEDIKIIEKDSTKFGQEYIAGISFRDYLDIMLSSRIATDINDNIDANIMGANPDVLYYSQKRIDNDNILGIHYNHTFSVGTFQNSYFFKSCFKHANVLVENEIMYIATSSELICINNFNNIEQIVVNIKSDKRIFNSNADSIERNMHTWIFTPENYKMKSIVIEMALNNSVINPNSTFVERASSSLSFTFAIIVLGIVIIAGVVVLIIKNINKEKNKI